MLTAVNDGHRMVIGGTEDFKRADGAVSVIKVINAQLNACWDGFVISLSNPFWHLSGHCQSLKVLLSGLNVMRVIPSFPVRPWSRTLRMKIWASLLSPTR